MLDKNTSSLITSNPRDNRVNLFIGAFNGATCQYCYITEITFPAFELWRMYSNITPSSWKKMRTQYKLKYILIITININEVISFIQKAEIPTHKY